MHAPLIHTPMMHIKFKKAAIVSLVAISTASALLTGCKKETQAADESVSASVGEAEQSAAGTLILGRTTAALSSDSTSLIVDADTAAKLTSRVGATGKFALVARSTGVDSPTSIVTYSAIAINPNNGNGGNAPINWRITITPTGRTFADGSLLQPADGAAYAMKLLTDAVKNTGASPSEKSIASMAAGHAEVLAADEVFRKIDSSQNQLEHLLGQVATMTAQIQTNNITIGALAAKEPAKTLAAIDKSVAGAKTGDGGVWYPSDVAPIPALAAIDASIADLNSKVDALKEHLADLKKQRSDADKQGDELQTNSEKFKGKQSVDMYTQGANLKKTAADLDNQIQDTNAKLDGLTRELSVATAQQTQLQAAISKFSEENKQVNANWDTVKQQISEVAAKTKLLVDGDLAAAAIPSTNPSIERSIDSLSVAGNQITKVLADLDKLRADAKVHLDQATKYYADAAKLDIDVATKYGTYLKDQNLQLAPERMAWQWQVEIHNDADPTLQLAEVNQRFARMYADAAYYSNCRLAIETALQTTLSPTEVPVKAALDSGSVAIPKSLDPGTVAADIAAAKKSADESFTQAEANLKTVIDHPAANDTDKALVNAGKVAKMIEQYGRWAFGNATSDKDADTYLRTATELAAALSSEGVLLPTPLPSEIAPPPPNVTSGAPSTSGAGPASLPTSQSTDTTQPTTSPSTNETPATAPAAPDGSVSPGAASATPAGPATAPADAAPLPTPAADVPATPAESTTPPATPATDTPAPPATPAPPK